MFLVSHLDKTRHRLEVFFPSAVSNGQSVD